MSQPSPPIADTGGGAPEPPPTSSPHPPPSARPTHPWTAWLELLRAGNLLTIASNALVGWAIGTQASPDHRFALATVAVMALYAAGMVFNYVCDARIDARERPARPIPSGRVESQTALLVVAVLFATALALLAPTSHAAVGAGGVLIALIVMYDLLHARSALSVILMAACRMMVYVVVACAAPVPGGWPLPMSTTFALAGALGIFVVGLSLVARLEASTQGGLAGARRAAPLLLIVPPLLPVVVLRAPPWWVVVLAVPMLAWILLGARHALAAPPRRGAAVRTWIAAIPLIDAFFLGLLGRPALAVIAVACWLATVLAHRRVAAT